MWMLVLTKKKTILQRQSGQIHFTIVDEIKQTSHLLETDTTGFDSLFCAFFASLITTLPFSYVASIQSVAENSWRRLPINLVKQVNENYRNIFRMEWSTKVCTYSSTTISSKWTGLLHLGQVHLALAALFMYKKLLASKHSMWSQWRPRIGRFSLCREAGHNKLIFCESATMSPSPTPSAW